MPEKISEGNEDLLTRLAEWQQGDFSLDCGDFLFRGLSKPIDGDKDGIYIPDFALDGMKVKR